MTSKISSISTPAPTQRLVLIASSPTYRTDFATSASAPRSTANKTTATTSSPPTTATNPTALASSSSAIPTPYFPTETPNAAPSPSHNATAHASPPAPASST